MSKVISKHVQHPAKPACITEIPNRDNGWRYKITSDDGEVYNLTAMSIPGNTKKGCRGTIQYRSGASYGLYFWSPDVAGDTPNHE